MTPPAIHRFLSSSPGLAWLEPATWRRHWEFGQVVIAIGELDGRVYCLESLPESTRDRDTMIKAISGRRALGDNDPAAPRASLAELVAKAGPVAVYAGLPGPRRLVDQLLGEPGRPGDQGAARHLIGATERAARALAHLHSWPIGQGDRATGATGFPPLLAHLRDALNETALASCRSAMAGTAELAEHIELLLGEGSGSWECDTALLHGGFSPDAVFVSESNGAAPEVCCGRWTGAIVGDPLYDLATFIGPLVELEVGARTSTRSKALRSLLISELVRAFVAAYEAGRGSALDEAELERLGSRVILNLSLHFCYYVTQSGYAGPVESYVADIGRLARNPTRLVASLLNRRPMPRRIRDR